MSAQQKPSEVCIGVSIEGDLLKLATLGRFGTKLSVMNLGTLNLPQDEIAYTGEEGMEGERERDPFADMGDGGADGPDYSEVHDFLQSHYVRGATVALSFGEPTVRTELLDRDPKEKPGAIVQKIIQEIGRTHDEVLPKERVGYALIGTDRILAGALLEVPPILNTFTQPLGSDQKPTKVSLVSTNDIALANLTRAHFRFREDEVVHVIYVSKEETRFYVMKGPDLQFIAPPIQQGASEEAVSMLNNRIELAAELAGYPKADKVVLAGAAEKIGLKEEILASNPSAAFSSLSKFRIDVPGGSQFEDIHDFALPVSVAWQKLQPKATQFYNVNLVPPRIKQEQNTLQIAWHGLLLILLIMLSIAGLGWLGMQNQTAISDEQKDLDNEREEITRQRAIVDEINMLQSRSTDIVAAATTLDTLLKNHELWTETLDTLAKATSARGNLWISEMKPDPEGGYTLIGFSTTRSSIPSFSLDAGTTNIREVLVEMISENKVFRYDMLLSLDDQYPSTGSRAAVWHDTVKTYIGGVTEESEAGGAE